MQGIRQFLAERTSSHQTPEKQPLSNCGLKQEKSHKKCSPNQGEHFFQTLSMFWPTVTSFQLHHFAKTFLATFTFIDLTNYFCKVVLNERLTILKLLIHLSKDIQSRSILKIWFVT